MKLFSVIAKKLRRRTRVKGSTAKRVARHQPHNAATRLIESYYVMPWALKATSPTKANKRTRNGCPYTANYGPKCLTTL